MLNTPTAVLGVLVLAVAVNAFLFIGYYSEKPASPPASSSPPPVDLTQPETNVEEATTPVTEEPPEEPAEQTPEKSPAGPASATALP